MGCEILQYWKTGNLIAGNMVVYCLSLYLDQLDPQNLLLWDSTVQYWSADTLRHHRSLRSWSYLNNIENALQIVEQELKTEEEVKQKIEDLRCQYKYLFLLIVLAIKF